MTGILFHGPEVFDSGWAARIRRAFPRARCMLAGAMSRTALFDSGLKGVETPGTLPSACVRSLARDCRPILLATNSKSPRSGLVFGRLVAGRAAEAVPLVQAECSGPVYSAQSGKCPVSVSAVLKKMGFSEADSPAARMELWRENGLLCRRMTAADRGDYILVNGIIVGRATGGEVVLSAKGQSITDIRGVSVKPHGLEKLERFGGVDLASAKLASTPRLRRNNVAARITESAGKGVVFIDHAGMHVYESAWKAAGAVTVGDDTTAVAGDILSRFGIPVIGIVDGDGDGLHRGRRPAGGSVILTVKADDKAGLRVMKNIFKGKKHVPSSFHEIKRSIIASLSREIICCAETPGSSGFAGSFVKRRKRNDEDDEK